MQLISSTGHRTSLSLLVLQCWQLSCAALVSTLCHVTCHMVSLVPSLLLQLFVT